MDWMCGIREESIYNDSLVFGLKYCPRSKSFLEVLIPIASECDL